MPDSRFDVVARGLAAPGRSRRRFAGLLAGGWFAALIGASAPRARAKKRRRKCKKPTTKCGRRRCCPPGRPCVQGRCGCPSGTIFCAGGGGGPTGCFAAQCCLATCSGATCYPANQVCEGDPDGAVCDCVGAECGGTCCPPGQACAGDACGACSAGSPNCPNAAQCGPNCFCVTSVEQVTACANDADFVCHDCADDDACTTLLGKPGLCIAGDCLGCPQNRGCTGAACPGA